jgi:hypothetical protein
MRVLPIAGLAFAAMSLSCGGEAACVPGEQVECACPGGVSGAQACNADGSSFGECSCDGTNPSEGGSPPLGDPCQVLANQIQQQHATKYDQCDIDPPEPSGGAPEGGASPCTTETQQFLQCVKVCNDGHLTCGVLAGDADASDAWIDCISPCLPED